MRVVYVDTSALIALIWRRDRAHASVAAHFGRLRAAKDTLITCNLVIAETATRLRYDAGLRAALAFRDLLDQATASGELSIRHADADLDARAWSLIERHDTRALSFADAAGAVTAKDAGAAAVFGLDADFAVLGFALEP